MESELAHSLRVIPDDELLHRLGEIVAQARRVEADLVAHIGEVDERRLYARFAFPSMFAYCTQALRLSEAEAYRRITVARAARQHPSLLARLRDGRLHLSGAATLVSILAVDNAEAVLDRATHLSKRQIEELVAELSPRPDVATSIRRLPEPRPSKVVPLELPGHGLPLSPTVDAEGINDRPQLVPGRVVANQAPTSLAPAPSREAAASSRSAVEALSPGRYKIQFTASAELRDKLERLVALMRSEVPDGDLAAIIDRAVTERLARLESRRFATTMAPRQSLASTDTAPTTRHVPVAVRRAVRQRDGQQCRFVDEQGRRCSERYRLELHHRHPFGMGGDHGPANVSLLCAAHNRHLAEHDYGRVISRRLPRKLRSLDECDEP